MKSFIKGIFMDGDSPSFGRVASGAALGFVFIWTTHIVFKSNVIPDLTGPIFLVSTLYAITKSPEFMASLKKP